MSIVRRLISVVMADGVEPGAVKWPLSVVHGLKDYVRRLFTK
jgi:hypothetical protein